MSSNIRITKFCEHCGCEYIAKTTVTRYCSHICNQKHYKQKKREEKINTVTSQNNTELHLNGQDISNKEYLSINETCNLIGVSERTLYRLMKDNRLQYGKVRNRTIIKRRNIDKLFN